MPNPDAKWFEPGTLIALGGVLIGAFGILFGILSHRWSRRESRLDALGKILQPMVRSAQFLFRANTNRRKCEQLKHSYPDPESAPEVIQRVNAMIEEYGELITRSEGEFRTAESEFASRHFRFPDRISRAINRTQESLSELGRLVNAGLFDKADVQLARFRDEYKQITDTARGWRLADPFEGIRKRFTSKRREASESEFEFELTPEEMDGILELLHKRVTTHAQNSFVVHPPKRMIDDPTIMKSDDVIDQLRDSVFSVVFQDGTAKMLSLPELMAFTFNLIVFAQQAAELNAMVQAAKPQGEREFQVSFQFAMQEIMRPEMVKVLLDKIDFAETPSDA